MSENTKYNGWTNRATWLIVAWYEPKPDDLDWIKEELEDAQMSLGARASEFYTAYKFFNDLLDLKQINWDELRETLTDDE
jgi:hypothetical protein